MTSESEIVATECHCHFLISEEARNADVTENLKSNDTRSSHILNSAEKGKKMRRRNIHKESNKDENSEDIEKIAMTTIAFQSMILKEKIEQIFVFRFNKKIEILNVMF
ncbi:CLUMA_CG016852, isoform A [Clunio marinus]|uniref:CLUMA_CG016852, isoform A n=1 Tax=Clunio marinus TaxID=568069 RepID=A0A1J1IWC8_9DIPT|nr:CLUMA_CG016852, isoform A [Clunio marinus]